MRRAIAGTMALVAALALVACESTQDKSARIDREGVRQIQDKGRLKIATTNPDVRVRRAVVVRDGDASAAAIELRNAGTRAQADVPVLITVRDRAGRSIYRNDLVGLQPALQRVATLRPGRSAWWVNDQLLGASAPASVSAKVGSAKAAASVPDVEVADARFQDDTSGTYLEGVLRNRSGRSLQDVPVYAVSLRGGRVVAAGRSIVPKVAAKGTRRFRIIFIGDPRNGKIQLTVAPSAVS